MVFLEVQTSRAGMVHGGSGTESDVAESKADRMTNDHSVNAMRIELVVLALADAFASVGLSPTTFVFAVTIACAKVIGANWSGTESEMLTAYTELVAAGKHAMIQTHRHSQPQTEQEH